MPLPTNTSAVLKLAYDTELGSGYSVARHRDGAIELKWSGVLGVRPTDQQINDWANSVTPLPNGKTFFEGSKQSRYDEIDARTAELITTTGFEYDGKSFSNSLVAQSNIAILGVNARPGNGQRDVIFDEMIDASGLPAGTISTLKGAKLFAISTVDNESYAIPYGQVLTFVKASMKQVYKRRATGQALKESIRLAADQAAVDAIVDDRT